MAQKTYAGVNIDLNDEGYFTDPKQWTKEVAVEIAKEDGLELTDTHIDVLEFLRKKFSNEESITIRSIKKSGVVDIKGFYKLFPGAPLKKATKFAGIPKPSSCV